MPDVKSITTAPLLYVYPTIIVEFSFQHNMFIKPGKQVRLAEAVTLDFIVRNTTITVPRVVDVVSVDGIVKLSKNSSMCLCSKLYRANCPDQKRSSMHKHLLLIRALLRALNTFLFLLSIFTLIFHTSEI